MGQSIFPILQPGHLTCLSQAIPQTVVCPRLLWWWDAAAGPTSSLPKCANMSQRWHPCVHNCLRMDVLLTAAELPHPKVLSVPPRRRCLLDRNLEQNWGASLQAAPENPQLRSSVPPVGTLPTHRSQTEALRETSVLSVSWITSGEWAQPTVAEGLPFPSNTAGNIQEPWRSPSVTLNAPTCWESRPLPGGRSAVTRTETHCPFQAVHVFQHCCWASLWLAKCT